MEKIGDSQSTSNRSVIHVGALHGQVTPSVIEYAEFGTGASAFGMGLVTVLLCMITVFSVVQGCGIGAPRKRDTPLQEWEKGR